MAQHKYIYWRKENDARAFNDKGDRGATIHLIGGYNDSLTHRERESSPGQTPPLRTWAGSVSVGELHSSHPQGSVTKAETKDSCKNYK